MLAKSGRNVAKSSSYTIYKRLENKQQLLDDSCSELFRCPCVRVFISRCNLNCRINKFITTLHLNLQSINYIFSFRGADLKIFSKKAI